MEHIMPKQRAEPRSERARGRSARIARHGGVSKPILVAGFLLALVAVVVVGLSLRRGSSAGGGAITTLRTADFHSLAFSPDNPNIVFFGHHNGLKRSEDGGLTWSALVDRSNFDAMSLAMSRANGRQLYLAGHDIFQVSMDGGATWQAVAHNLPGTDIHGFAMSP